MTNQTARRTIRFSALYDLLVTAGFALPLTAPSVIAGLADLHQGLGLSGSTPDATDTYTLMFANLMGSLVVVWAAFRLFHPSRAAGAADTVARVLFAWGMIAALSRGASQLVAFMLVLELAWALVQGAAIVGVRRGAAAVGSTDADR
jgi:hypothetical protein